MKKQILISYIVAVTVISCLVVSSSSEGNVTSASALFTPSSLKTDNPDRWFLLPLDGNVYPTGHFHATISVGKPPKAYVVDVDTGISITWLKCQKPGHHDPQLYGPPENQVHLVEGICWDLHDLRVPCTDDPTKCCYEVEYADGDSSHGVLAWDWVHLGELVADHQLAIGCDYKNHKGSTSHLDGLLGLSRGHVGILSQLRDPVVNVMGHCLSGNGYSKSFLFFGTKFSSLRCITWTPLSPHPTYYSPGMAQLIYAGSERQPGPRDLHIVYDTGSTYTYFVTPAFNYILWHVQAGLSHEFVKVSDPGFVHCWKHSGRRHSNDVIGEAERLLKPFGLFFREGRVQAQVYQIPPRSYLVESNLRNVCLGVFAIGMDNINIIGAISMLNTVVIYDSQQQRIGWGQVVCDRSNTREPARCLRD